MPLVPCIYKYLGGLHLCTSIATKNASKHPFSGMIWILFVPSSDINEKYWGFFFCFREIFMLPILYIMYINITYCIHPSSLETTSLITQCCRFIVHKNHGHLWMDKHHICTIRNQRLPQTIRKSWNPHMSISLTETFFQNSYSTLLFKVIN